MVPTIRCQFKESSAFKKVEGTRKIPSTPPPLPRRGIKKEPPKKQRHKSKGAAGKQLPCGFCGVLG